jgi:hypothetical protein
VSLFQNLILYFNFGLLVIEFVRIPLPKRLRSDGEESL